MKTIYPIARIVISMTIGILVLSFTSFRSSLFSEESKVWPATDKAKTFVEDNMVIGFFASPFGAGWTEDKHLHEYFK